MAKDYTGTSFHISVSNKQGLVSCDSSSQTMPPYLLRVEWLIGATRGVTVSMSTFLACHQCYCAGSSLALGLNLRAVVCGIF